MRIDRNGIKGELNGEQYKMISFANRPPIRERVLVNDNSPKDDKEIVVACRPWTRWPGNWEEPVQRPQPKAKRIEVKRG